MPSLFSILLLYVHISRVIVVSFHLPWICHVRVKFSKLSFLLSPRNFGFLILTATIIFPVPVLLKLLFCTHVLSIALIAIVARTTSLLLEVFSWSVWKFSSIFYHVGDETLYRSATFRSFFFPNDIFVYINNFLSFWKASSTGCGRYIPCFKGWQKDQANCY